jgi:hypothetical protein
MKLGNFSEKYRYHRELRKANKKMITKRNDYNHHYVSFGKLTNVKITRPIEKGVKVIRFDGKLSAAHQFGRENETVGEVLGLSTFPDHAQTNQLSSGIDVVAVVDWLNYGKIEERMYNLIPYDDYLAHLKLNELEEPKPIYRVDQILYVKYRPDYSPTTTNPAIGSEYEIDVKVTRVIRSEFGSVIKYEVYIPNVGPAIFKEDSLIPAADRLKYKYPDYELHIMSEDLQPFFTKGQVVKFFAGNLYNEAETVIVKLNDVLKSKLKK